MTYAYQLPDFLGSEWLLEFNTRDASSEETGFDTLFEADGVAESGGWDLSDDPTIFWGTPGSAFWETRSGTADGVADFDWNGDGDFTDAAANYDLNHIVSVTGCEATANSEFTIYNEPEEFDYNFRNGPLGEFDGRGGGNSLVLQQTDSEPNKVTVRQLQAAGASFVILPPWKIDGEEAAKAGREIPMMLKVFDHLQAQITDYEIQIWHVFPEEGLTAGELRKELIATFEYIADENRYRFDWKTEKDFSSHGTTGINYVIVTRDLTLAENIISENTLIISSDINPMPLEISADGVGGPIIEGVTVKIKWK